MEMELSHYVIAILIQFCKNNKRVRDCLIISVVSYSGIMVIYIFFVIISTLAYMTGGNTFLLYAVYLSSNNYN